jgi:hypothetical protein
VPSSPPNTSWDVHYRRRGRTREHFDYALTSEELSPEVPVEYLTTRVRPRSADGRPHYDHHRHHSATSGAATISTSGSSNKNRSMCLPNAFYPGEPMSSINLPQHDGIVAPYAVTSHTTTATMGQPYDDEGVRYYPSERYNLPTASLSDGGVDEDAMAYAISRQRALGHIMGNVRSMETSSKSLRYESDRSATPTRVRGDIDDSRYRERTEAVLGPSNGFIPQDYHPSTRRFVDPQNQQQFSHAGLLYGTRESRYNDYVKENLIMYGDGLQDAPSASTGFSQEELLQRKRREETWQKRREKRVHQTKNRVINLPSSLFTHHTTSSRHSPHQQEPLSAPPRQQQQQQQDYLHHEMDMVKGKSIQYHNTVSKTRSQTPLEKSFAVGGLAGISFETSKNEVAAPSTYTLSGQKDTGTSKTVGAGDKGVRGLMVREGERLPNQYFIHYCTNYFLSLHSFFR